MNTNVMIIDDTTDQLQLMQKIFKMVDPSIQIMAIRSGDEALQILRSGSKPRPKVILMDLLMPKRDGSEILQELKSDSSLKAIPVCMFSNGALDADVRKCYELGASFYFQKPSGLDSLKKFVEQFTSIWFEFASDCP